MRNGVLSLLGLAAVVATGGLTVWHESNDSPVAMAAAASTQPPPVAAGYRRALDDMASNFWGSTDATDGTGRILSTDGRAGAHNGLVMPRARGLTFWQMSQYANVLYEAWRLDRSGKAAARVSANWHYVQQVASSSDLAGDGAADHSVNISDDAAWKANYLAQVHEVTQDPAALAALYEMLPATFDRFALPGQPRRMFGKSPAGKPIAVGPNGILYAAADDKAALATFCFCSSLYEAGLANASLYAFSKSGNRAYRDYAVATWEWIHARLRTVQENDKDAATGIYSTELNLPRDAPDSSQPSVRNRYWGKPIRGLSAEYSGGTLSMAVLSARLFRVTGEQRYLVEAKSIIAAFTRPDAFGRTLRGQLVLVNERDPWTDGYWYPATATEVLTLPGVDSDKRFRTALHNTARVIIAGRTANGFYSADWSGPEFNFNDKTRTWAETARLANEGAGGGQADPEQIMTSASSVSVVQAAYALGRPS